MLTSGVRNSLSPLTGEAKRTPSSLILRISPSDQTWKPPLSVRMGLPALEAVQAAKLRDHVQPGRSHRWKVLPRMICAPMACSDCGSTPLTVP
jgi:hypothetical protein